MRHKHQISVQADGRGRILLPSEVRAHLGLEPKSVINVETRADGTVVLRDPAAQRRRVLQSARGSLADSGGSVDQLIAERRAEAKRDRSS
jgi:bifunctional DNA-binding transcriptional regulator/antitoxin component of YhaV-PrlF toxin-antitoxin module